MTDFQWQNVGFDTLKLRAYIQKNRWERQKPNVRNLDCIRADNSFTMDPNIQELDVLDLENGKIWRTENTCVIYSFTLNPGSYIIEAWGAAGGHYDDSVLSKGGHIKGELHISEPTRMFAVAGDVGQSKGTEGDKEIVPGGCNGGGSGQTISKAKSSRFSGGGGASHVAAVENTLSHRILVAGGAGGSFKSDGSSEGKGGKGGYETDGFSSNTYQGQAGQGAILTRPGQYCVNTSTKCNPGSFGEGGNVSTDKWGCGGGGGWFGGASSYQAFSGGGGGSNFVFNGQKDTGCDEIDNHPLNGEIDPLVNTVSETGVNPDKGYVTIQALDLSPKPNMTAVFSDLLHPRHPNFKATITATIISQGTPRRWFGF